MQIFCIVVADQLICVYKAYQTEKNFLKKAQARFKTYDLEIRWKLPVMWLCEISVWFGTVCKIQTKFIWLYSSYDTE